DETALHVVVEGELLVEELDRRLAAGDDGVLRLVDRAAAALAEETEDLPVAEDLAGFEGGWAHAARIASPGRRRKRLEAIAISRARRSGRRRREGACRAVECAYP